MIVALLGALALFYVQGRSREKRPEQDAQTRSEEQTVSPEESLADSGPHPRDKSAVRVEIRSPIRAGRVLCRTGAPLAGVSLSWTAFDASDLTSEPAWQDDDWGSLERRTVWTTSDESGEFAFAEPPGDLSAGSVIWATRPGFQAGLRLLEAGLAGAAQPDSIELEEAPPFRARVLDGDSRSVEGASLEQFGLTPRFSAAGGMGEARARRVLYRKSVTGPDGTAELPTFPGELVLLASRADQRSLPWRGRPRSEVVLRLAETFVIEGRTALPDWSSLNYTGERRLTVFAQLGNVGAPLAVLRPIGEGGFGPLVLPIQRGATYRLQLEGSPVIPEVREFEAPAPGAHLWFDLEPRVGHAVWVIAMDSEKRPIVDAEATATWREGGVLRSVSRRARADGFIELWSFPETTIYVCASAPGYFSDGSDPLTVPLDTAYPFILRRAGHLRGRCTHEGKPVENFEVVTWRPGQDNYRQTRTFYGREDGSFELDDVPLGELFVTASGPAVLCDEPRAVTIPEEGFAEVALELLATQAGVGVVVDSATGKPVPHATVQGMVMGDWRPVLPYGPPTPVTEDGSFRITSLVPGANRIEVAAPGYSTRTFTVRAIPGEVADVGRVPLDCPQPLEIRLTSGASPAELVDFTAYEAFESASTGASLPRRRFASDGLVRYEAVDAGARSVTIETADPGWTSLMLELRAGAAWSFEHRVAGARQLVIEVHPAPGQGVADTPGIYVKYENGQGVNTVHGTTVPDDGRVALAGIEAESVTVHLLDRDWNEVSVTRGFFEGRDELHLDVHPGGAAFRFRVVDPEGAPVAGATITVNEVATRTLFLQGSTDAEGICELHGVPASRIVAGVSHPRRGARQGIVLDGAVGEAEIVLEKDARILLAFRDGDERVPGVECRMVNLHGQSSSLGRASGSDGTVEWKDLSTGPYRFAAERAGCWPVELEAEARRDAPLRVVQIRRLGDLVLEVQNSAGLRVAGQSVSLESVELATAVEAWLSMGRARSETGLTTDRQGRIRLAGLPHGAYRWTATTSEGSSASGTLEVEPAVSVTRTIVLP
jgi:hypothetical protein